MKPIEIQMLVYLAIFSGMFNAFILRLALKWRLFDLWDTYLPFKRCVLCVCWWINLLTVYLLINRGWYNPFDMDLQELLALIMTAAVATTISLLAYENRK